MKVSGKKVAENRAALVSTAQRLLQERGFDGAGVVEISREAGLTQGALYGQFGSKDGLAAEAIRTAFAEGAIAWRELGDTSPNPLAAYLDAYLSESHLTDVGSGCVLAACLSEVRRQDPAIGAAFTDGLSKMIEQLQRALPGATAPDDARRRALTVLSGLVGSVAMARAVAPTDPALAREIIAAARCELERLAVG
jgi:TetR/AcrR family transcriptional repressor of nem operon